MTNTTTALLKLYPDSALGIATFEVDISSSGAYVSVDVGSYSGNMSALFRVLDTLKLPWDRSIADVGSRSARYRFEDPAPVLAAVAAFLAKV